MNRKPEVSSEVAAVIDRLIPPVVLGKLVAWVPELLGDVVVVSGAIAEILRRPLATSGPQSIFIAADQFPTDADDVADVTVVERRNGQEFVIVDGSFMANGLFQWHFDPAVIVGALAEIDVRSETNGPLAWVVWDVNNNIVWEGNVPSEHVASTKTVI